MTQPHSLGPKNKPYLGSKASCISTALDIYSDIHELSNEELDELMLKWSEGEKMTHNPLDDAKYQGRIYYNLMKNFGINL